MRTDKPSHSFPVATIIGPEKIAELRQLVEDAMEPEAKVDLFNYLMADSRKPFEQREYKKRIGSLPATWLRQALNLPVSKRGDPGLDESKTMIWSAVEEILSGTRHALEHGSPLGIVAQMYECSKDTLSFYGGLIGQPADSVEDQPNSNA